MCILYANVITLQYELTSQTVQIRITMETHVYYLLIKTVFILYKSYEHIL